MLAKGETFGIVFHTVRRELWRPWVQALRDGRGGGFSLCRAVADCAVLPIKFDCGDEIFVGHSDRIGARSNADGKLYFRSQQDRRQTVSAFPGASTSG
jgi:hypothetical protein